MANTFTAWLNGELQGQGWTFGELHRRSSLSVTVISDVIAERRRPGLQFCVKVARAFGVPPEDVLRRAGLLPSLPPAVEEERELLAIIRDQAAPTRRTLVSMLRGLARRPAPALTEPRAGYGDPGLDELVAIYHRLQPEWRPAFMEAARIHGLNAHAGEAKITGADVEEERTQPESN
jgi:transcriptional regulator with XRE-family HTH domain